MAAFVGLGALLSGLARRLFAGDKARVAAVAPELLNSTLQLFDRKAFPGLRDGFLGVGHAAPAHDLALKIESDHFSVPCYTHKLLLAR